MFLSRRYLSNIKWIYNMCKLYISASPGSRKSCTWKSRTMTQLCIVISRSLKFTEAFHSCDDFISCQVAWLGPCMYLLFDTKVKNPHKTYSWKLQVMAQLCISISRSLKFTGAIHLWTLFVTFSISCQVAWLDCPCMYLLLPMMLLWYTKACSLGSVA